MDDTQELRHELFRLRAKMLDKSGPFTEATLMPFGKYQGEPLMEVPDDYLRWWFSQNPNWEIIYIEVLYEPYPKKAIAKQKLKLHDYITTKKIPGCGENNSET